MDSQFRMADVSEKKVSVRRAVAVGCIRMAPETAERVRAKKLPKGDALSMAEVAGVVGAKRTSDLLPLCHPIPLEAIRVRCIPRPDGVEVRCEVKTSAKTGVEMEALMGVQCALACIWDLTKPVDAALSIEGVYVALKEGGKSGRWSHPHQPAFAEEVD